MAVYGVSGVRMFIGSAQEFQQDDWVIGDFTGVTWVEIGSILNLGDVGSGAEYGSVTPLGNARPLNYLTSKPGGQMTVTTLYDLVNAGQAAMLTASGVLNQDYAFQIRYPDSPPSGHPSTDTFIATVGEPQRKLGNNTDAVQLDWVLGIHSNLVHRTAGSGA